MRTFAACIALALLVPAALAVQPVIVNHTTEKDFFDGQFTRTLVDSTGRVRLAPRVAVELAPDAAGKLMTAVAVDGRTIYAAGGTDGTIWKISGDQVDRFAQIPAMMVTGLAVREGRLLAIGAGRQAGLWHILADGSVKALFTPENVRYFWAMAAGDDGAVYIAAGAPAGLWKVGKDGQSQSLLKPDDKLAKNLLSVAVGPDGSVFAGSDSRGLIWKVTPGGQSRVIFDAAENEIASLLPDANGGLFVATSDASKAKPDAAETPSDQQTGRSAPAADQPAPQVPETEGQDERPQPRQAGSDDGGDDDDDAPAGRGSTKPPSTKASPNGPGNAVYYIRPDGLVEAVFRRPVTILAMVRQGEKLILATGHGGRIYRVSLDGDVVGVLADSEAEQVTALAAAADGSIGFATANPGSAGRIGAAPAESGTYESKPIDAGQIAAFGSARLLAKIPEAASVKFSARSGNLEDTEAGTWSDWSVAVDVKSGSYFQLDVPAGRFLQYRLELSGPAPAETVVESVELAYQVANLPPAISSLTVEATDKASGPPQPSKVYRQLDIQAADANKDKMEYTIEIRPIDSRAPWLQIAEKQNKTRYVWDTRGTADGIYEIRVVVTDAPSNPPAQARQTVRISEPVTVDNAAPVITDLGGRLEGRTAVVEGRIADKLSRITDIAYAVDSQDQWTAVAAGDGLTDSPNESFKLTTGPLEPGTHRVVVRAVDEYGNTGYASVILDVAR
ncbi:MAG: hypothetical protein ACOCZE_10475 [Planctomycetota bacterium]